MVPFRSHLAQWRLTAGAVFLFLAAVHTQAADTNSILDAWFAAQAGVHTLSADLVQTRTLKTLVQPLITPGHLWFQPPDKFHWELGHPAQTIAIRNGEDMYIIYPRLKRAEHYPLGSSAPAQLRDAMSLLDAGFPSTRAQFDAQFQLQSLADTNGQWVLSLQPHAAGAQKFMPELTVMLDDKNFALAGTELTFIDGSRMRNDFKNIATNAAVDNVLFEEKPPADFHVTEPFSK
jgi:outer membrane lipoprotein-sorting protein